MWFFVLMIYVGHIVMLKTKNRLDWTVSHKFMNTKTSVRECGNLVPTNEERKKKATILYDAWQMWRVWLHITRLISQSPIGWITSSDAKRPNSPWRAKRDLFHPVVSAIHIHKLKYKTLTKMSLFWLKPFYYWSYLLQSRSNKNENQ